jgi:branched-chain amino acid transport system permease protein
MVSFDLAGQLLLNGIVSAGIYAVVAVGLNIILGVMGVINFAQGEFMMLGMYAGYFLYTLFGISPIVAIVPVFLIFLVLGFGIDLGIMDRAWKYGITSQIIITIGISTILINLSAFVWTANLRSISVGYALQPINIFGLFLSVAQLVVVIFAIVGLVGLGIFFQRTKIGMAIRAVSQDRDIAAVVGISRKRVYMYSFGLSMGLTAAAGLTLLPLTNIYPTVGQAYLLVAFVVLVLGGMGSYTGAIVGSVIIGEVQSFATFYYGDWSYVFVYLIFIAILLIRPVGLLGTRMRI